MKVVLLLMAAMLAVARPAAADPRQRTDSALSELHAADQAEATASAAKQVLATRYEGELRTIDRLKKQRGSWRRDRQLRDSLAASLETAKQLEAANAAIQRANARHQRARQEALAAIRAELQSEVTASRRAALTAQRDRLTPAVRVAKKIILPDLEIDPLADPEELDQQAAAIRQSEAELVAQINDLEQRGRRLDQAAELRRQHGRAEALSDREEGPNRRGTFRGSRGEEAAGARDDAGAGGGTSGNPGGGGSGSGSSGGAGGSTVPPPPPDSQRSTGATLTELTELAESSRVLGDVVDAAALESLRKAQASADPAVRAAAAKQARAAAAAKLTLLRQRRALIEARARGLRAPSP
jgi:hypothetical protein